MDMNKEYLVYNYSGSKVVVSTTKGTEYLFDSGTKDNPFGIPLKLEEIIGINMKSNVFKLGLLFFETAYEEELYRILKITNYKDILKDWEIEDILLHPTFDGYHKILKIEDDAYFSRVTGVLTGLNNSFIDVPNKSKILISARAEEFAEKKRKTAIVLDRIISDNETDKEKEQLKKDNDSLKKQVEQLTKQVQILLQSTETKPRRNTKKTASEE
jgi:hypothetical protein